MNHLVMEKTVSTPAVDFDPDTCVLRIAGESFPENAAKFYAPILAWIGELMERPDRPAIVLECDILYRHVVHFPNAQQTRAIRCQRSARALASSRRGQTTPRRWEANIAAAVYTRCVMGNPLRL